ncbi:MAG: VPLPA-CTERM sorting domain-containing protein [Steroidobacteraceae bacterium]
MTRKLLSTPLKWAAALTLAMAGASANAALVTGDIAFTSFNADEDGWSIVALANIDANSTIYFRDDEWTGSAWDSSSEGTLTWSTGSSVITAGTVIRFAATDTSSRTASVGTLTGSGDTGTNATAETIYAYLGSSSAAPTTFLTGVTSEATTTNLTNAGLTVGVNAVALTSSTDYAGYTGVRSGLSAFSLYASVINNSSNWYINVGGDGSSYIPDTTAFAVQAVPLPAAVWLLISGLAGMFGFGRRREAALASA